MFIGIPYPSTILIKAKTGSEISIVDIRKLFGSYGPIKTEIETFTDLKGVDRSLSSSADNGINGHVSHFIYKLLIQNTFLFLMQKKLATAVAELYLKERKIMT